MSTYHTPVMLEQSMSALDIKPDGVYLDATFGGGGHSRAILSRLGRKGRLIVMDQDTEALANAPEDSRLMTCHANFRFVHNFVHYHGFDGVDGILADLGVSSHQFDTEERGFSFRFEDSRLDMRMNSAGSLTAAEVVNTYSEEDIERILRMYGEVEGSRKAACLICRGRATSPIETSAQLVVALKSVLPPYAEHKYLAKVYQALRIEVNREMEALEKFLPMAVKSLKSGGRLAVITYHSLEDRIVKNAIRDMQTERKLEKITRKPVLPEEEEIASNSRARSAKLRVAQKI